MGKQPKRWELIISHHLPYRTVGHLSKLWAAHQAVLQQKAPGGSMLTTLQNRSAPYDAPFLLMPCESLVHLHAAPESHRACKIFSSSDISYDSLGKHRCIN